MSLFDSGQEDFNLTEAGVAEMKVYEIERREDGPEIQVSLFILIFEVYTTTINI